MNRPFRGETDKTTQRQEPRVAEAPRLAVMGVGFVFVSSLAILIGWWRHIPLLRTLFIGQAPVRLGTALALCLFAVSAWLVRSEGVTLIQHRISRALAFLVSALGASAIAEYFFHWYPAYARFLPTGYTVFGAAGSALPSTAITLVFLGTALYSLDRAGRWTIALSQGSAVGALLLVLLALVGYVRGMGDFYREAGYAPMPIPSALCLSIATASLLALRPYRGFVQAFTSELLGGRMSRRIWLPSMIVVVVLGALVAAAQQHGHLANEIGDTLFAWANVALFSVAMCLSCLALNRAHARLLHRDRLYAILSQTNQSIVRSHDRTALFAQICRIAVGPGAFRYAWIGLWDKGRAVLERAAQEGIPGEDSLALAERAIHSQTATLAKGGARSSGSQAAFPIVMNGRAVGCLVIDSSEPNFFGEEETQLLREVASDMAFALDMIDREARRSLIERDLWESQSRLRLATAAADIGFWDWDIQGNRVHLSPEWTHQIGYTEKELTEEKIEWEQRLHPEDRDKVSRNIQEHLSGETTIYESEFRLQHRDRSYRWIHSRAQAIRDAAGKPVRMVGWHLNVTDRKLAEESVRLSENRLNTVIQNLDEGLGISDMNGTLTHWNRAALDMLGFESEEPWLRALADFSSVFELSTLAGQVLPVEEWPISRLLRGETLRNLPLRIARLDIEWSRIFSFGGNRIEQLANPLVFVTMVDITERTWAETAVRESEARFRELAEHVDEVFWISDPARKKSLYISPAYEKIWARSRVSVYDPTQGWLNAVHPADRERVQTASETRPSRGDYDETYRILRPDGTLRWIRDRAFPVRNADGKVYRLVGTSQDITARRQAEIRQDLQHAVTAVFADARSLEEAAKKVMGLIGSTMEWSVGELWLVDRASGSLRSVENWSRPGPALVSFLEQTRKLSFRSGEGIPGQVLALNQPLLISDIAGDPRTLRKTDAAAAGLNSVLGIPVRSRETMTGVMVFLAPVIPELGEEALTLMTNLGSQMGQFHQRLLIEEQFLQSQKMEAIGQLAGGVAHDFNNLLTVIKAYPQLILQTPNLADEAKDWLEQMSLAADRAAGLTRQLLTFSRKQIPHFRPIDLNETVNGMSNMLRRIIGEDITLHIDLTRHTGEIDADIGMLEQVLMNLVVNARDAMPEGGQLTVSTRQVQLDAAAATGPGAREGDFLVLAVTDTGCGISPEVMKHIFEPFFTTKEPGKGTGLGLATIYGIVEQHRGWVDLESRENSGTTFKVYLPMSRSASARPKDTSAPLPTLRVGKETILLVEDEPAVRMLSKVILERLGYKVIDAVSGVAALEIWNNQKPVVDLLVTDMIMPHGVTGRDLAEKLRIQKPDLKILFTTGYSPTSVARGLNLIEGVNFIQKPYIPQTLSSAIRNCLEQPPLSLT